MWDTKRGCSLEGFQGPSAAADLFFARRRRRRGRVSTQNPTYSDSCIPDVGIYRCVVLFYLSICMLAEIHCSWDAESLYKWGTGGAESGDLFGYPGNFSRVISPLPGFGFEDRPRIRQRDVTLVAMMIDLGYPVRRHRLEGGIIATGLPGQQIRELALLSVSV